MISIHLAVEDDLSETVLRKILQEREMPYDVARVFKRNGFGYLKKNCRAFNNLARVVPVLLLTDLDRRRCPVGLIQDWLDQSLHPCFLFRVAVREVEAWLLAHDESFRNFLGLRRSLRYGTPENLDDPKSELLSLAARSPRRQIREALVRTDSGGKFRQGPAYNSTLTDFVNNLPRFISVEDKCPSLGRLLGSLQKLENNRKK